MYLPSLLACKHGFVTVGFFNISNFAFALSSSVPFVFLNSFGFVDSVKVWRWWFWSGNGLQYSVQLNTAQSLKNKVWMWIIYVCSGCWAVWNLLVEHSEDEWVRKCNYVSFGKGQAEWSSRFLLGKGIFAFLQVNRNSFSAISKTWMFISSYRLPSVVHVGFICEDLCSAFL